MSFISFLDSQPKTDFDYGDLTILLTAINQNYIKTQLYDAKFTGKVSVPYYTLFGDSKWNTSYDDWKAKHEVQCEAKPMIILDVSVNSLKDVLKMLETYDPASEYNINLKALNDVKPQLIQLNNMIGMESIKTEILDQLLYFVQGLHIGKESDFKHTVIYGPPGTGKTEVAKIIGTMYSRLGILKNNIFKKATRNDFVAGYLGQTAIKTKKVIDECFGGCLFIDEAYSLANNDMNDSYSKECIDILCESLSDHRDNLMVIIAGYEHELNETFFKANPGLNSRFIWRFKIEDYTPKELMQIFEKKAAENEWVLDWNAAAALKWFEQKQFKYYGRDMELLFTYTKIAHGRRIYGKTAVRKNISLDDLNNGYKTFIKNKDKPDNKLMNSLYI